MADWEIECCQPPPGVGDHVEWRLQWVPADAGAGVLQLALERTTAPRAAREQRPADLLAGVVVRAGLVTAWWADGTPTVSTPAARGLLVVDAHGLVPESMDTVAGQVVAVDVIEQAYRRTGPREYEPISEDFTLRRVERSPKWFHHGWVPTESTIGDGPAVDRQESGVLVHLDVGEPQP